MWFTAINPATIRAWDVSLPNKASGPGVKVVNVTVLH
jgi:hypothetical protein